ncbi:MAG: M15 family metallopeptidase [Bacteroidota bacterium]
MKTLSGFSGLFLLLLSLQIACAPSKSRSSDAEPQDSITIELDSSKVPAPADSSFIYEEPDTSDLERTLISQGLINILSIVDDVVIEMKYSTTDNFLNEDVYEDFSHCYLQKEVAEKLAKVQASIKAKNDRLSLIVFDCVRPRSVQYKMWEIVKGTDQQKYVAAPGGSGSMHNYGAAVDLSLVHLDTGYVDMGTPFDFFGDLAQPRYEEQFLKEGKLTQDQFNNRRLFRAAMLQAGFHGILSEWWHFNGFPREVVKKQYQIVE